MSLDRAVRARTPTLWALWKLARPAQLLLILLVYALGVSIAAATGTPLDARVLYGALALLPTAASVHYANEYADYETDRLTERTPFSGGSGALVETGLPRSLARNATLASAGVAALAALLAVSLLPPLALLLLVAIAVLGWGYSLPPLRFSRRGLGEVDNSLLGGLVLPVYGAAVVAGPLPLVALSVVPFTCLVFCNLLATQWPDRAADEETGKHTLVVRWSESRIERLHGLAAMVGMATLAALDLQGVYPPIVTLASLPAFGLAAWAVRRFPDDDPLPSVAAMVALAAGQTLAWASLI
ncbi:prenyltransferase [Natronomonas sp. EA1]|uniref:prenyltransferase n=1 Tax=Natronomonas sp. EA1 TaxID=3421655 RepID=UPI003EC00428